MIKSSTCEDKKILVWKSETQKLWKDQFMTSTLLHLIKLNYFFLCAWPGCDHVIDKSKNDLWKTAESFCPKGYQVVFDANGVATLQESYNHVASGGRLVIYGESFC